MSEMMVAAGSQALPGLTVCSVRYVRKGPILYSGTAIPSGGSAGKYQS